MKRDIWGKPIPYPSIPNPGQICPRGYGDISGVCNPAICCLKRIPDHVTDDQIKIREVDDWFDWQHDQSGSYIAIN